MISDSSFSPPVVALRNVSIWTPAGTRLLDDLSLELYAGQRWVVLGPNGAGKTTLLSLLSADRHPSSGDVTVLGETLGRTDMRALRARIGRVDPSQRILDWLSAEEAVMTGLRGTLRPTWTEPDPETQRAALDALTTVAARQFADREISSLSVGERQRVRIARALIANPELLLLDEPATGLDFPAREALLASLDQLAAEHPSLPMVMVSHHLEELPTSITHVLLLRGGRVLDAGPIADMLTSEKVSTCFGFPIDVRSFDGRWMARATANW